MNRKPKSNRAKCDYWLDRADSAQPPRFSDPRMAADGQAALFSDAPTASLFTPVLSQMTGLNETPKPIDFVVDSR